jgi:hypothetical protein
MPKFEVVTQINVTTVVEAASAEEAIKHAEYFAGSWMEPTYEQMQDYNSDHAPIEQVQDWDAVISTAEETDG